MYFFDSQQFRCLMSRHLLSASVCCSWGTHGIRGRQMELEEEFMPCEVRVSSVPQMELGHFLFLVNVEWMNKRANILINPVFFLLPLYKSWHEVVSKLFLKAKVVRNQSLQMLIWFNYLLSRCWKTVLTRNGW